MHLFWKNQKMRRIEEVTSHYLLCVTWVQVLESDQHLGNSVRITSFIFLILQHGWLIIIRIFPSPLGQHWSLFLSVRTTLTSSCHQDMKALLKYVIGHWSLVIGCWLVTHYYPWSICFTVQYDSYRLYCNIINSSYTPVIWYKFDRFSKLIFRLYHYLWMYSERYLHNLHFLSSLLWRSICLNYTIAT